VAGAVSSVALMLQVGQRDDSTIPPLLLVLFTGWVVSPFAALLLTEIVAKRRSIERATLHWMMLIVTVTSLAIYAYVAFAPPKPQPAFWFLIVPLASWVLLAIAVIASRRRTRR